jgi:rare lipoprotein A
MRILGCLLLAVSTVLVAATGVQAAPDIQGFSGKAAYYSPGYSGKVASGADYDPAKFTAAHKTLPFGTRLLVTDLKTRRSVTVTVNDRGPFTPGRVIDLSLAAARALKMTGRGIIQVKIVGAANAVE